ncbi:MAG: tyrosine-type recombinase/integrase [Thermoleophilia bacterium]|nr:tyrosine-type recombinase/integrase [Thermoleophilia bacterium]
MDDGFNRNQEDLMLDDEKNDVGRGRRPANPILDDYRLFLEATGYRPATVIRRTHSAAHLGRWLELQDRSLQTLTDGDLEAYRRHLPRCRCSGSKLMWRKEAMTGARLFLRYLRGRGLAMPAPPVRRDPCSRPLIRKFTHWMRQHRGTRSSTLRRYGRVLDDLLQTCGEDPAHFTAGLLRQFVSDRGRRHSRGTAQDLATSVRSFLRYLVATGQCPTRLKEAIPPVANWRLSALPRYLPPSDIDRILASCPTGTPLGLRDRAILLLFCRLGLRAHEVMNLRLGDLEWSEGSLVVAGKGGRRDRLPLPQEVGDAILAYLKWGRPPTDTEILFLRARAPRAPFSASTALSGIARRALRRAQVKAPTAGAHLFRHSAATEMLRQGSSLEAIAQILRHRSLETTAHYAKVDLVLLREIAQPWPEVTPC